jgi:hypothetical protein
MKPADGAWLAMGVGVIGFNAWAMSRGHKMLSERADDYLASRHAFLAEAVFTALYVHIANKVSPRYDPIHWVFIGVRTIIRRAATPCVRQPPA